MLEHKHTVRGLAFLHRLHPSMYTPKHKKRIFGPNGIHISHTTQRPQATTLSISGVDQSSTPFLRESATFSECGISAVQANKEIYIAI